MLRLLAGGDGTPFGPTKNFDSKLSAILSAQSLAISWSRWDTTITALVTRTPENFWKIKINDYIGLEFKLTHILSIQVPQFNAFPPKTNPVSKSTPILLLNPSSFMIISFNSPSNVTGRTPVGPEFGSGL
uniref:CSON007748 protein n=1 Tax=Culicoides sonorensis TaxID=179676 RepID=A0A336MVZ1_CULSO